MRRGFGVILQMIALLAKASCQDNERLGSGSNPNKGSGNGFQDILQTILPDRIPLDKGDAAADGNNKKTHSKQGDRKDFRKSFLFMSTMFYSLQ